MNEQPGKDDANISKRQILRVTTIVGGATFAGLVISLAKMKLIALIVGPAGVGLLGALTAVMTMGYAVAGMGLDSSAVRQLSSAREDPERWRIARWGVWTYAVVLATLGSILCWIFRVPLSNLATGSEAYAGDVGWLSVGVGLTVVGAVLIAEMQAQRRMADFARTRIWAALFSSIVGVTAVYLFGMAGVLAAVLATPVAVYLVALWLRPRVAIRWGKFPGRAIQSEWRVLANLGLAVAAAAAVGSATQAAIRGIIASQLGLDAAGLYQASFAISSLNIGLILGAMIPDYYPRLSAVADDRQAVRSLVNEQLHVSVLVAAPALLGIAAVAPLALSVLYTSEFGEAALLLRLQLSADALRLAGWVLGFVLLARKRTIVYVLLEVVLSAVFLPLTWLAAPNVGVAAAGAGYLVGYAAVLLFVVAAVARDGLRVSRSNAALIGGLMLLLVAIAALSLVSELAAMIFGLCVFTASGYYSLREVRRMGVRWKPLLPFLNSKLLGPDQT
ncbi:O-antigen translocase [Sphingomonas sp.]|uniref:O-antigen translocase n=1 Tax=Sphingomonas sp. TaxID=28214 RepID=UPI0017C2EB8A|nr:O-antigen translocase [Sphingomonas sp.]MBA3511523.1 O-antigen translocase [Sphingomonas sp.]